MTAWRIENLSDCDYEVEYYPGEKNIYADALSRPPMLGPNRLARVGAEAALELLLKTLPATYQGIQSIWVWGGADTVELARKVQAWRTPRNAIIKRAVKETLSQQNWEFAVLMPRSERATAVAQRIIQDGRPACILMPTDLVHYTAQQQDGSFDLKITEAIQAATKLQLMTPCMTWVCLNVDGMRNDVFINETVTSPPGPLAVRTAKVGTLEEWIVEQPASLKEEAATMSSAMIVTRDSGLQMILGEDDGRARIYVPAKRRDALIEAHHVAINHLGPDKTYASLHRNYMWPGARADVRKHYAQCSFCDLSKARRNQSHKMWSAVQGSPPRSRWGMDFYGVKTGYVLGLIDLDSLHVELAATKDRTAVGVRKVVKQQVLERHGKFDHLRSDHAKEFVGKTMSLLKHEYGYIHTTTGGYQATGNATMERFWAFLGLCLRLLTDDQYEHYEDYLQKVAWAWNSTPSESLGGISPFEVMTGTKPRTVAGSLMEDVPPATEFSVDSIRVAAAEYTRLAKAHADYTRQQNADHLNKHGRLLKELKVGSHVKIYKPPSQEEVKRRGRKAKHITQWTGPYVITAKPSPTYFHLADVKHPEKTFERHLTNVRPMRSAMGTSSTGNATAAESSNVGEEAIQATCLVVGEMVLACEDEKSGEVDLARVTSRTETTSTLHCWGTRGTSLKTSKYTPVFVRQDGQVILRKPRGREKAAPWTWEIGDNDIDALIAVRDVEMKNGGRLTAKTVKRVGECSPQLIQRRFG